MLSQGQQFLSLGNAPAARELFEQASRSRPDLPEPFLELANLALRLNRPAEALPWLEKATAIDPTNREAMNVLATLLLDTGRDSEAIKVFKRVLGTRHLETAYLDLAERLLKQNRFAIAGYFFLEAGKLAPRKARIFCGLARSLALRQMFDEARECLEGVLAGEPQHIDALVQLAVLERDGGRIDSAIGLFERAVVAARNTPRHVEVYGLYLQSLLFSPDLDAEALFQAHRIFAGLLPEKWLSVKFPNNPDRGRKLKVGYLSPDFYEHVISLFVEPILENHCRENFEVYCYSVGDRNDHRTRRLIDLADHWRQLHHADENAVARQIQADGIDILVDLAGHSASRWLGVYALHPAPIQAGWLGHLGTSGHPAIGYRISDAFADPVLVSQPLHTEKLKLLPHAQWCYSQPIDVLPGSLPKLTNGYVTFGSFNHFAKVNDQVIELWAELLRTVPSSKLQLWSVPAGSAQQHVRERFQALEIDAERIDLHWKVPAQQYLEAYRQIDIALDTFPYSGGTTTFDALWMGVPVVTLPGSTSASRSSKSILQTLGMDCLVANTKAEYIAIAKKLAEDTDRLSYLRNSLRPLIKHSPGADGSLFTRNLEAVYREMWIEWCGQ